MSERIVDTAQAASLLNVSTDTIRRWCEDQDDDGRSIVFPRAYAIGTRERKYWRIPFGDLSVIRVFKTPEGLEGGTR